MRYLDLKSKLKDQIVFSLNDIRLFEPDFRSDRLVDWQKKNYIQKIINGYYIFTDVEKSDLLLYLIANKIHHPSYISLETALQHYRVIPESVFQVTSLTTNETREFNTEVATFVYSSVKNELFFGYSLIEFQNLKIKMASLEKAMIDFFYLRAQYNSFDEIDTLRLNYNELSENLDISNLMKYVDYVGVKSVEKRIDKLLKLIEDNA
jgi:predicted transcriptional regulator of viral defense system